MNQKKAARRRFGVLILLSLLLHAVFFLGIDWRRFLVRDINPESAKTHTEKEALTIKFNLAPTKEPEPPLQPEPDQQARHFEEKRVEDGVTQKKKPEPSPKKKISKEFVPIQKYYDEFSSNNQQNRDANQVVAGQDKSSSEPVEKRGNIKKEEVEEKIARKQDQAPIPVTDKNTFERSDSDQTESKALVREGGAASETVTTSSERAVWRVPQKDGSGQSLQKNKAGHASGEGNGQDEKQQSGTSQLSQAPKQSQRQRVEEDLKTLLGDSFSRDTESVEKSEVMDITGLEEAGDGDQQLGNLALLDDDELRGVGVEQPFSETHSKELKLRNILLTRMSNQVKEHWVNPYNGGKVYRGVIKVDIDENGYLRNAYVYRQSGLVLLDISVLDAIRAVKRYEVPENKEIARNYFRNLDFYYSSIEEETELMPFEFEEMMVESETKQTMTTKETP